MAIIGCWYFNVPEIGEQERKTRVDNVILHRFTTFYKKASYSSKV